MNNYIDGTIMEMLKRLKTLKVKIPVNTLLQKTVKLTT